MPSVLDKEEKNYELCCDYCLRDFSILVVRGYHCDDSPRRKRGCHETFISDALCQEHFHPVTRGCRWPGNIEDFYRKEGVWHKKEPKLEEEGTPDRSPNSKRTQGVAKRTTSKDSRERTSRDDQQRGLS